MGSSFEGVNKNFVILLIYKNSGKSASRPDIYQDRDKTVVFLRAISVQFVMSKMRSLDKDIKKALKSECGLLNYRQA
jgi:hypothetical protein